MCNYFRAMIFDLHIVNLELKISRQQFPDIIAIASLNNNCRYAPKWYVGIYYGFPYFIVLILSLLTRL